MEHELSASQGCCNVLRHWVEELKEDLATFKSSNETYRHKLISLKEENESLKNRIKELVRDK